MYIPEKNLIMKVEDEFKKRIPFLTGWKITRKKSLKDKKVDLLISAKSNNQTYHFCVEVKTAGYPQYIRDGVVILKRFAKMDSSRYPVIVVPFISGQSKEICDEYHVGYMDFSVVNRSSGPSGYSA